jgi:alkaline phosphatase
MRVKSLKCLVVVVSVVCMFASMVYAEAPKYVFLFIGDGMGTAQRMAAEEYLKSQGKDGLLMNTFPAFGMVTTYQNDRFITDSAAAGTALATGVKTNGGYIGVDPNFTPVENMAEKAKKKGLKVGIVTSVTINHATPASFYAHQKSRNMYYEIGLDLANSGFDYFGGGGLVDPDGERSEDPKGNVFDLAKTNGYTIVTDKEAFMALTPGSGKIWAYGVEGNALPYSIDTKPTNITLTEFTQKGVELLDGPDGFFMMVEGGKIDWTCHANDATTAIMDTLEFDNAIKVAYDFYQAHPEETLLVVTGDHETGGLTLGFAGTHYDSYFDILGSQTTSYDVFSGKVMKEYKAAKAGNASFDDMLPLLKEHFGLETEGEGQMVLADFEIQALKEAFVQSLTGVKVKGSDQDYLLYGGYDPFTVQVTHIVNQKAGLGWTSYSHTGVPLPATAIGVGAEAFNGFYDNTDVAKKIMAIMGAEFQEVAAAQ